MDAETNDEETATKLPGAEPLRSHIHGLDMSVSDWCEKHEIDRFSVQKLLNGKLQRVSVELAFDLEEASEGAVAAKLWIPEQEIRDAQQERRSATARARARAIRAGKFASTGTDGTR